MKIISLFLILFFPAVCFGADELSYLVTLDAKASDYRKMSIECVTDAKLTKKALDEIETCKVLYNFTTEEFSALKESLIKAEENAKIEAESNGLESPVLREKLVLIMSAKTHMQMAGAILSKIH
ncbi:hypothetical protein [Microbulbifer marinus]|uniref:Uncharacterized protein n=1 Tax=Microbulbifer marinus TaxID=658218 RepID=A0A1H4A4W6_9GAMM|nr:hypothetical protein [Microbulbifer marinus]SEA30920.1 hypothetical protein SAMN05216562_2544 [Microbulbifer marinus]